PGNGHANFRRDLEKLLAGSEDLFRNGARTRAIFACSEHDLWEEIDSGLALDESALYVGQRFHLAPLARVAIADRRVLILLIDREANRFLVFQNGALKEIHVPLADDDLEWDVRSTGAKGNSRFERAKEEDVLRHFRVIGDKLEEMLLGDAFDGLV